VAVQQNSTAIADRPRHILTDFDNNLEANNLSLEPYLSEPRSYIDVPHPFSLTDVDTVWDDIVKVGGDAVKVAAKIDICSEFPAGQTSEILSSGPRDCPLPASHEEEQSDPTTSGSGSFDEPESSFSEYETDLEDDETTSDALDIDFSKVSKSWNDSPEQARGEVISKVLSPIQQELLDRMMTEFWIIFKQEIDFFP
jgi:hypothetical protein